MRAPLKVQFGEFTLDAAAMQLRRGDRDVRLSKKAFELLRMLVENRGRVVTKAELHAELWPVTHVTDTNVNVLVTELRKALGDTPRDARLLRTVHGVGYRFCGDASDIAGGTPAATPLWLVAGERRFPLSRGANIIGRDPACDVWIDSPDVSRRHASITTGSTGEATLEDLGSTNGTYVRSSRITAPSRLHDGDRIHLGPPALRIALTFRVSGRSKETTRVRPSDGAE